jgi:membrane-bound ClpP family serine protease
MTRPLSVQRLPIAWEHGMIILGIVLLLIGFLTNISILTTIGVILVVVGAILAVVGMAGREVGGSAHWY